MKHCIILLVFLSRFAHLQGLVIKDFTYTIKRAEKKCAIGHVSHGDTVVLSCQLDCSQSQITKEMYIEFRKWSKADKKFNFMGNASIDSTTCISTHEESATAELSGLQLQACFLGTEDPTNNCKENLSFPSFDETCQEITKSDNNNYLRLAIGIPVGTVLALLALLALGCCLWKKYKQQSGIKLPKDDNQELTNLREKATQSIRRAKTGVSRCNLF